MKKILCLALTLTMVLTFLPTAALAATSDIAGTITPTTLVKGDEGATVYNVAYGASNGVSGNDPYKTFYGVQYAVTVTQPGVLAFGITRRTGDLPISVGLVSDSNSNYSNSYSMIPDNYDNSVKYFRVEAGTYYVRFCCIIASGSMEDTALTCAAYLFQNEDRTLSGGTYAAGGYKEGGTYYKMVLSESGMVTVAANEGDNLFVTLCDSSKTALGSAVKLSDDNGLSKTYSSLAKGTYYIKALPDISYTAYANRKYVYRIKYTLAVPTGLKAASASYNSIKLTWNAVSGANGYYVYRATSKTGTYTYISGSKTTARTYTDTGRTTGKTYYYKVKAYWTVSGSNKPGAFSAYAYATPVPAAPTGFKAASASYSSIKLSWNAVTGANGYKVWRATSKTGTYSYIKITTSRTYTDTKRTTGRTYYYKVRAYRTVSGVKKYGVYSAIAYAKPTLSKVSGLAVKKVSSTGARISYGATSGASGYETYRRAASSSMYVLVRRTTVRSWTNTGLKKGCGYYYKVRAYRTVSGAKVYGSYSEIKYIKM